MRYQIIDRHGNVKTTIIATPEFMLEHYPAQPIIADNNEGLVETWGQYREAIETPVAPIYKVTMAQARKALVLSGVSLASVQTALEAIDDPAEMQLALIDWEFSPTVSSNSALVNSMAFALGLSTGDVSGLFALAGTL